MTDTEDKQRSEMQPDVEAEADTAEDKSAFTADLVKISIKAAAVALSVVMLILSVLTVALPLQAMRVFNKLGMSERALESGNQYITRELKFRNAGAEDDKGNYTGITGDLFFSGDDFVEALDVCTGLSKKLTARAVSDGDERSKIYYAEMLERYTRMYASLSDFSGLNSSRDTFNQGSVPLLDLRPTVYSYAHTVRVLNFRARVYLGETENVLYNSGRVGDSVISLDDRFNTMANTAGHAKQGAKLTAREIDDYVDFASQIGEYLTVEFEKLGVAGQKLNEGDVRDNYAGILDGTEFSLFIVAPGGYTRRYDQLRDFSAVAQAAYDYDVTPNESIGETKAGNILHKLYWLNELYITATKLKYMNNLLYYGSGAFGAAQSAIQAEYVAHTTEMYTFIDDGHGPRLMDEVYNILLAEYKGFFTAA